MISMERVLAEVRGIPLIILSPRSNHQAELVRCFVESGQPLWSYTFTDQDQSPAQFVDHFVQLGSAQLAGIGGRIARLKSGASLAKLAEALAADLGSTSLHYLLLDEFDRVADSPEFETFLKALLAKLPPHLQVIIKARELSFDHFSDMLDAGSAIILNDDPSDGTTYRFQPKLPYLEVQALGRGHAFFNGRSIDSWEGPLVKHLFFYFVDHPMVTRDEIFETFWSGLSIRDATNVFHVTKRKITERIGFELTEYRSGFYSHARELTLAYDVAVFEQPIKQANALKGPASIALYQRAYHLYRSEFLYTWTPDWIINRRNELQASYIEALMRLGTHFKDAGDYQQAMYYYQLVLAKIPYREDVHRLMMEIYSHLGRTDAALSQYQKLVKTLDKSFRIAPSKESRQLYQQLREKN